MRIKVQPLDKLFSEVIRKRAMRLCGGCERCGSQKVAYNKGLQCAHCFTRSRYSTRWHEDNALGLCGGCHIYIQQNKEARDELFISKLGQHRFDKLKLASNIPQKVDKEAIRIYLKELLREAQ